MAENSHVAQEISVICALCRGLVFNDATNDAQDPKWERTDTLPDLPGLTASAHDGCSCCAYLRFLIKEKLPPRQVAALVDANPGSAISITLDSPAYMSHSDQVDVSIWGSSDYSKLPDGLYSINLLFHHEIWEQPWRSRAWIYAGTDEVADYLQISLRKPATHVLEASCLGRIYGWLKECQEIHPRCRPPIPASNSTKTLPTRLIDIGDSHTLTDPQLVASDVLPSSISYIALSYCWGSPSQRRPQLTTTTVTIVAHQNGIPVASMPLTFQDLIALSREFGVRYLWIDALCIIQDDAADWEREAACMYAVYRDAYLTVVVGGPSCHSGFLQRPDIDMYATIPFQSQKEGTAISGSYHLYHLNVHRTWEAEAPHHMAQSAWSRRAWTFQEDIMSTRVLYFTDKAAFFRCQTQRCLEQSTLSYNNVRDWHGLFYSQRTDDDDKVCRSQRDYLYRLWDNIFITYAERQITKDSDRLPALSGLARIFAYALRDDYFAGIWRRRLPRGLLWYVYSNSAKPTAWRAPSWSWASWLGIVETLPQHGEPTESRCIIEEIKVQSAGQDPFGMLRDGWLVLRGCLRPVSLRPSKEPLGHDAFGYAEVIDEQEGIIVAQGVVDSISMSGLKIDSSYRPPPVELLSGFKDVSALLVALICEAKVEGEDPDDDSDGPKSSSPSLPTGLLVVPADEQKDVLGLPVYRRIGLFSAVVNRADRNTWEDLTDQRLRLI